MNRYRAVWSAALLFFGAFYALLIPIPLYLESEGLPDWQIGLVLGAFGIASLIGRPLSGAANDSFGSRPVILFGTVSLSAGALLMSFTANPAWLFLLRIIQATGYVSFTTAATALVAELAPERRRGAALALFGAAANVAITLTPAAVSAGLDFLSPQFGCPTAPCPTWCAAVPDLDAPTSNSCPLWGRGIGHSAFILSAALSMFAGLLVWQAIRRPSRRPDSAFRWSRIVDFPTALRGPMLTSLLFGFSFGALFAFLPLLTDRRDLASAGPAYVTYGLSIIATRILTGRMIDRPNRGQVLLPALLLNATGLAAFAFASTLPFLLAGAVLMGIGSGVSHPALIATCVDRMPDSSRGRAAAGFYLAFDLGIGIGSWFFGLVLSLLGLTGLYLAAALVSFAGALTAPFLTRKQHAHSQPAA